MGLRMHKSFKVAPGVRVNVSKSGLGASFGVRGARYSVHSSRRQRTTVGLPGTGISHVTASSSRGTARGGSGSCRGTPAKRSAPVASPSRPKPGLFAPKGEKAASHMVIGIGPGVTVDLPLSRDLIGLALAEVLQRRDRIADAIDVVECVTPTAHAAVSLAELYCEAERFHEVIPISRTAWRTATTPPRSC